MEIVNKYFKTFTLPDKSKIRLGHKNDGGYVIYDLDNNYDCLLSCGIGNDSSFELDFYNKYKTTPGFLFDGTIVDIPKNFPIHYYFIKKNISIINDINSTDLKDIINLFKNIFLKIDIEGWEFPFFANLSEDEMNCFKQIVGEFHSILDNGHYFPLYLKEEVYKKLSKTHYLVHVHGNNAMPFHKVDNKIIPMLLEMTWVRKSDVNSVNLNYNIFPDIKLDGPNDINKNEYIIDFEPFVFK